MASDAQTITFQAAQWSDTAACELSQIADATNADIHTFEVQVTSGEWSLFEMFHGKTSLGFVVWSVETDCEGFALIINAAIAKPQRGVCVAGAILDYFSHIGRTTGAHTVRCWTTREGLRRKLENRGARRRYVMEFDLW